MEIRYFFGDTKLNDQEKRYIEKKILKTKKLLQNYSKNELFAEAEIKQDKKGLWKIELMIRTPHELYRVVKQGDNDYMKVVDAAENALMNQIRRAREKTRDSVRTRDKRVLTEA